MINLVRSILEKVSVHQIGINTDNQGINISEKPIDIEDDNLRNLLFHYFFKNFKQPEYYGFTFSNGDINLNPLYNFVKAIFHNPELMHNQSIFIAKHLYEQSGHPNIKPGDLIVAYIKDLLIEEEMLDAVGIFKSESKDTFLKLQHHSKQIELGYEQGINIEKLDKACLILNIEESEGYRVCIIDRANKESEAKYWKDSFLNLVPKSDDYHNTQNFIDITKSFIDERLVPMYEMEKFEQAGILNRSKEYFKHVERFEDEEYEDRVFFSNKEIINEFQDYKKEYTGHKQIDLQDQFFISPNAFKKNAKFLKSVIKLDKNFSIYVHGNHDLIEKQKDEKGTFYKIYYEKDN